MAQMRTFSSRFCGAHERHFEFIPMDPKRPEILTEACSECAWENDKVDRRSGADRRAKEALGQ